MDQTHPKLHAGFLLAFAGRELLCSALAGKRVLLVLDDVEDGQATDLLEIGALSESSTCQWLDMMVADALLVLDPQSAPCMQVLAAWWC